MGKFNEIKILGGIGSLLALVGGFIPFIGPVLSIIGFILLVVAVKNISDVTKDESIYKNYLISFFCSLIAVIAVFIIMMIVFGSIGGFTFIKSLETASITDFYSFWQYFGPIIKGGIVALIIGWILLFIGSYYLRKSYNLIAKHTKVDLFRKTGFLYFIGAISLIVLVGLLILLVAHIFEIISYLSLPDEV